MVRGTVQTEVDAERNGGPCWILGTAIEAHLGVSTGDPYRAFDTYLVGRLRFQLLEYLLRLGFRSHPGSKILGCVIVRISEISNNRSNGTGETGTVTKRATAGVLCCEHEELKVASRQSRDPLHDTPPYEIALRLSTYPDLKFNSN